MFVEFILFVFLIIAIFCYLSTQRPKGIPPGPRGWPLIGVLVPFGKTLIEQIGILKGKYGDIFSFPVGSRLYVVLTDYKLIKAAFAKPEFSGRPEFYSLRLLNYFENAGISFAEGTVWNTNRKFAVRHLRDMGLGKSTMEAYIQHEVGELIKTLEKRAGEPVELDYIINVAVVNIIWSLVGGERATRSEVTDKEKQDYTRMKSENIRLVDGPITWLDNLPWLIPLVPTVVKNKWMYIDKMIKNRDDSIFYFKKTIKEHQETLDKDNPRDLIDRYLLEMDIKKDGPDKSFREDLMDLLLTIDDLFAAGSDTTSSTFRWAALHMADRQDIQAKVQKEIDEIVPNHRMPCLDDRQKLPYTDAMIYDLQRFISLAPISLPHRVTADMELNGYRIPEDTLVIPYTEGCHRDKKYWERPDELYPEHFLNEEGRVTVRKEGYLPFSVGRRSCPGEALAGMELFLFIASVLQKFAISFPPGVSLPTEPRRERFIINHAPNIRLVLKPRS